MRLKAVVSVMKPQLLMVEKNRFGRGNREEYQREGRIWQLPLGLVFSV